MKFREIVLLLLIIGAGTCVYFYQTAGPGGGWTVFRDLEDGWFFPGHDFSYEETRTIAAPLPDVLEISNSHGWVEVRGEDREDIRIVFKKRIMHRNEEEARAVADRLKMTETRTGNGLVLSTNRAEFKRRNFETGFVVTVPAGLKVTVKNSYGPVQAWSVAGLTIVNHHGAISAMDIAGAWDLTATYENIEAHRMSTGGKASNKHADILVEKAGGAVRADCDYGNVTLNDIGGDAAVAGEHNGVSLTGIKGKVDIDSTYEDVSVVDAGKTRITARHAAVRADMVRGGLSAATTYEPVEVSNIEGDLSIEGNNVRAEVDGVTGGSIRLNTSYEDADISGFSGRLQAVIRHGDLVLKPSGLEGGLTVEAEYCNLDLYWPPDGSAPLEARSKGGEIRWELDGKIDHQDSNGTSSLRAFGGSSGTPVSLSTTYGDIRIMPGGRSF